MFVVELLLLWFEAGGVLVVEAPNWWRIVSDEPPVCGEVDDAEEEELIGERQGR